MAVMALLAGLVTLAACAGHVDRSGKTIGPPRRTEARTFVFRCEDGYGFTARIEGQTAWLFLPGQTVDLPRVPSGSGARYSRGAITFWNQDERALLSADGQSHRNCKNNHSQAIWEHAKLNGVDFRAVGNEPGWHLEISSDTLIFVGDYGQTVFEFKTPPPAVSPDQRQTIYRAANGSHRLVVRIQGRRCHDTMSDEKFEATVSVSLDGQQYQGCGRALH